MKRHVNVCRLVVSGLYQNLMRDVRALFDEQQSETTDDQVEIKNPFYLKIFFYISLIF